MSGMWELPTLRDSVCKQKVLFRVRHSVTVTDYVVSVVAQSEVSAAGGEWVDRRKLLKLPLTGLAKKILSKRNII
jgi:hypothetical protein